MKTIKEISERINCKVLCGHEMLGKNVEQAFASDLMNDVLAVENDNILLITGLANLQVFRTAEMADFSFIICARNGYF